MQDIEKRIREQLISLSDSDYKVFHSKLIPNIEPDAILGVRTPELRKFAKEVVRTSTESEIDAFMRILPHKYYDENNLHAFLIEQIKDYDKCVEAIDRFLPYVDNWATCDMMRPKVLGKNLDKLADQAVTWINSEHTYTKRFGIGMLMTFYLDDAFDEKYVKLVSKIVSDEYYVNMMVSWYFATALAKQYAAVIPYIEENRLPDFVHNKSIQKAIESNRISKETKEYLKTLKRK